MAGWVLMPQDGRMAPVPDDVTKRFDVFATRARAEFGSAVRSKSLGSGSSTPPMLHVGPFSVVAADGLVIDIAPTSRVPARRWELGWDEADFAQAWFLLADHLLTERLEPGSLDGFVARVIATVGEAGDVKVSTVQAEFDRVLTVTPRRHGSLPFEVLVIKDDSVVVSGKDFGWWDLGGDGDDGLVEALRVVTQFVVRGGTVRSTWRTCDLLDVGGAVVGGSYRDGVHRLRPRQLHFLPYVLGPAAKTVHPSH
ncbi:hypothetical protein [Frigoribacterium sp. 2355]